MNCKIHISIYDQISLSFIMNMHSSIKYILTRNCLFQESKHTTGSHVKC